MLVPTHGSYPHSCLLVLCGLPGAGKSTLAAAVGTEAEAAGVQAECVTFDDIEQGLLTGDGRGPRAFDPAVWREARRQALTKLDSLLSPITLRSCYTLVIADDTMHLRSMRAECFAIARRHRAAYVQAYVQLDAAIAAARNAERPEAGGHVPEVIIYRMAHAMEPPDGPQIFERTTFVPGAEPWKQVWEMWCGHGPEGAASGADDCTARIAARELARSATASSAAHARDTRTRRLVAAAVAATEPSRRGALAVALNYARRSAIVQGLDVDSALEQALEKLGKK